MKFHYCKISTGFQLVFFSKFTCKLFQHLFLHRPQEATPHNTNKLSLVSSSISRPSQQIKLTPPFDAKTDKSFIANPSPLRFSNFPSLGRSKSRMWTLPISHPPNMFAYYSTLLIHCCFATTIVSHLLYRPTCLQFIDVPIQSVETKFQSANSIYNSPALCKQ